MSVSSLHLVRHFEQRSAEAMGVLRHTETLLEDAREAASKVALQRGEALAALARAYLAELEAGALAHAEQLTGFRGFTRRDPLQALARQTAVLHKTVQRVSEDERYRRRQFLVGPHGELTRELEERRSLLEPWQAECARFEGLEGFEELVRTRYDTPEFSVSWLSARYWKLWAAGDRICEALGMDDFGDDVLPAYQKVAAERLKWLGQVQEVEAQVDAVHELARTHDQALADIPRLPQRMLEACWQALAEHLEHADPALLQQWLGDSPDRSILLALRRAAGLAAKADFLAELQSGLESQIAALSERRSKFDRKAAKFSRSKNAGRSWPDDTQDLRFGEKSDKMLGGLVKTRSQLDRMMRYDSYERFDLTNEPELWWVEFTHKRPPRHAPRLFGWYERNQGRAPRLDARDDNARAVAAAVAAQADAEDLGYVS